MTTPQDVAVTYTGTDDPFKDRIYRSGLTFAPGQTRLVPATLAQRFLRHSDVFKEGAAGEAKAAKKAEKDPSIQERLDQMEQQWGVEPATLHRHLHALGPNGAADFVRMHGNLLQQIAEIKQLIGSDYMPVIARHEDQLMQRLQNYGAYSKPEDYLQSFNDFIRQQINQSAALSVVVNRPKDLTREQLKEVRLLLDQHSYTEAMLQTAWRSKTNQDIAASIIGHIRQAALGEALLPFQQRVDNAMQGIYSLHAWTAVQRRWLDRLASQLKHEVILDQQFVNTRFSTDGGAKRLNAMLDGKLEQVLQTFGEVLWPKAA